MITLELKNSKCIIDEKKAVVSNFLYKGNELLIEEATPLFIIALREKEEVIEYFSTDFNYIDKKERNNDIEILYQATSVDLQARVFISIDKLGGISYKMSVANGTSKLIDYVDLLPLTTFGKLAGEEGGKGRILYPYNEGAIYDDLNYRFTKAYLGFSHPSCPTDVAGTLYPTMVESQFIGYLLDGYGLYMGMHDETFAPKGLDFYISDDKMRFMFRYFGGLNYGESLAMTCTLYVKPFDGDWMNCADIYKEWYERNKPEGLQYLRENKLIPKWLEESPTVVVYAIKGCGDVKDLYVNKMYPYKNAIKYLDILGEETGGKMMPHLMHWEGTAAWNAPYVWPPYGGEKEFKEYVDALHKKGHKIGLYCSGIAFSQRSKIEDYNQEELLKQQDILDSLCIMPNGELAKSANVLYVREGYDLCIKGKKTVEIMKKEVQYMVDADVDFIQILDQNLGGGACFCYSDKHNHPVGQGAWAVDGMREMLDEFSKIGGNKTLFGTECTSADAFLKVLNFNDVRYQVNYLSGASSIPLTSYLFHEYLNNFMGNGTWTGIVADINFLMYRIAYSFVAGDLLCLFMNENGEVVCNWATSKVVAPNRENITGLIKQMNSLRREYKDYLMYGKIVRPKTLDYGNKVNVLKRAYCGKDEVVQKLMTGRFMAVDGSEKQFVVNYNSEPIEFKLDGNKPFIVIDKESKTKVKKELFEIKPYSVEVIE